VAGTKKQPPTESGEIKKANSQRIEPMYIDLIIIGGWHYRRRPGELGGEGEDISFQRQKRRSVVGRR
jgi:hypothetical protein